MRSIRPMGNASEVRKQEFAILKKMLLSVGAVLAAAVSMAQVDPNRTVAVVNGVEIKGSEYYRRMEFLSGVGKVVGNGFAQFPPGFLTIEQLITEKLILQVAKDQGVYPTDQEVDAEIKNRVEDYPKLLEDWAASGRSREELNDQVRLDVAQFKILTKGVNVTDQEAENFYNTNPTMFTIPESATLRVIAVPDDDTQNAVDADLKTGKPFADVAKARSVDITKENGGWVGPVSIGALNPNAQALVKKTKIGETTEWMKGETARVKFLVEDKKGAERQPLTPALRRQIRRDTMMTKGKVHNDISKLMAAARKNAKIDIKEKEFALAYKNFVENMNKVGSAPPASGSNGG